MEDGEHGLPAMLHPWWVVRVGLHVTFDGGRTLAPRAAAEAGSITRVLCGSDDGIPYGVLTGAARRSMV